MPTTTSRARLLQRLEAICHDPSLFLGAGWKGNDSPYDVFNTVYQLVEVLGPAARNELQRRVVLFGGLTGPASPLDRARRQASEAFDAIVGAMPPDVRSSLSDSQSIDERVSELVYEPGFGYVVDKRTNEENAWIVRFVDGSEHGVTRKAKYFSRGRKRFPFTFGELVSDGSALWSLRFDNFFDEAKESITVLRGIAGIAPEHLEAFVNWFDQALLAREEVKELHLVAASVVNRIHQEYDEIRLRGWTGSRLRRGLGEDLVALFDSLAGLDERPRPQESQAQHSKRKCQPAQSSPTPLLKIDRWQNLAIGIHESGRYYAFSPRPNEGDRIRLNDGQELPLRGKRWRTVLNLLAESEDGFRVQKTYLIAALKLLPRSLEDEKVRAASAELTREQKKSKLWTTMSDLGRKLRKLIHIKDKEGADRIQHNKKADCIVFDGTSDEEFYVTPFIVRCILKDETSHLRFGARPDAG